MPIQPGDIKENTPSFLEKYSIEAPAWNDVLKPAHLWSKDDLARVLADFGHFATTDCCLKRPAVIDFLYEILQQALESKQIAVMEDQETEW